MIPVHYDITIRQGAKFELPILYLDDSGEPIDLSTSTAKMHIRPYAESGTLIEELTSLEGITLGEFGTIDIEIGGETTAEYDFEVAEYDFFLFPSGVADDAIMLLEGNVTFKRRKTK